MSAALDPEASTEIGTVTGVHDTSELFAQLSRWPDLDAAELLPYDASDRLLLDAAAAYPALREPDAVAIIGDRHGALTLGAVALYGAIRPRVFQDPVLGERARDANAERLGFTGTYASLGLSEELLRGAKLVLMQLPRSLAELEELTEAIASFADPDVTVLAAGRVKHMTLAMNDVFARSFAEVRAGRAEQKSRLLTVSGMLPAARARDASFPKWGSDREVAFELAAFGATFGGPTLDHGSRLLLSGLPESGSAAAPSRIVDLGCGNGVLAVSAALRYPQAEVLATDQSRAAVAATSLTAARAGVAERVTVLRADGAEQVPDGWADLILLNPPFHSGSTVHTAVAHRLIRSCARALAPGGEMRIVFNSQLGYRPIVERAIGPTQQISRDRNFTVLSALRKLV